MFYDIELSNRNGTITKYKAIGSTGQMIEGARVKANQSPQCREHVTIIIVTQGGKPIAKRFHNPTSAASIIAQS